jgi:hypothetical protein
VYVPGQFTISTPTKDHKIGNQLIFVIDFHAIKQNGVHVKQMTLPFDVV